MSNNKIPTMCKLGFHKIHPSYGIGPVVICTRCERIVRIRKTWFTQARFITVGIALILLSLIWIIFLMHGWAQF
jgi:hypothetical protein